MKTRRTIALVYLGLAVMMLAGLFLIPLFEPEEKEPPEEQALRGVHKIMSAQNGHVRRDPYGFYASSQEELFKGQKKLAADGYEFHMTGQEFTFSGRAFPIDKSSGLPSFYFDPLGIRYSCSEYVGEWSEYVGRRSATELCPKQ